MMMAAACPFHFIVGMLDNFWRSISSAINHGVSHWLEMNPLLLYTVNSTGKRFFVQSQYLMLL